MSKEEFMKIQTCVLKVNIHCDGCKSKVKKILQKIDGVFKTTIDAELGKVTVSGNVDHNLLIKKLQKAGKHAELWGAQKPNSNNNQLKNMQLDSGKNGTKGQKGGNINPPKGGGGIGGGGGGGGCGQRNQQQQQVQQMKGFQDLKGPAFKEMKMPLKDQNQKSVKFNLPGDDDLSDFDDDDAEFEDYELEDELDDEFDEPLPPMNKPIMGNGRQGIPDNIMMMMMNGNNGGGGSQNGKKGGGGGGGGGGGSVPVQVNMGNSEGKNGNGGKKGGAAGGGGGGGGNNQNQRGKNGKNGGGFPQNGNNGGGGANNNKNGNNGAGGGGNGNIMNGNASKKGHNGGGGGGGGMNDGFQNTGGPVPQGVMPNIKVGQMGNMPMGPIGNIPAVQGLPAAAIAGGAGAGGGGGGGGYFQGAGPDLMPGNPYHQQQYMAAVMNQQRAMGNERSQPMMYARPPPAVNYVPPHPYNPYPYPYPYPSFVPHPNQPQDPSYTHFFSDENALSCNIM
ncbi:heavy metal-associated isoprenylated plant protein 33-like [Mangifera indica]|uniref:heavy metal-associated isoprenylated plant protein 33-like n=1 Tax=Mangifera indica TaxID=29780 RepID=UPI001CFB41AE|nr:heavy metal-associated isoprenylated plant protein 33-like [Mangifera indica]